MGKVLDIKEKISLEDDVEVLDELKNVVTEADEETKYLKRLSESESFENTVVRPLKRKIDDLSKIDLAEIDIYEIGVTDVSDKVAYKAIYNQGKIDGIRELLHLFGKN